MTPGLLQDCFREIVPGCLAGRGHAIDLADFEERT